MQDWNIWGLPTDNVSIDNGILVTRGKRWPAGTIDPQNQANSWVKAMEQKDALKVIKLTDANYLRTLESSIRIGNPVLVEDIGEVLDPALEPILQKAVFAQNGRQIRLGDTDVDYDPNFKFYLTTKIPNPHYLPEVCIKVTIINFTVTIKGLEDQLLGDVVRKERPDLEEAKDRLVVSISNDKKQLKELEDKILRLLKESEGNILDDEVLINTLQTSKVTSGMISGRLVEAEETGRTSTKRARRTAPPPSADPSSTSSSPTWPASVPCTSTPSVSSCACSTIASTTRARCRAGRMARDLARGLATLRRRGSGRGGLR